MLFVQIRLRIFSEKAYTPFGILFGQETCVAASGAAFFLRGSVLATHFLFPKRRGEKKNKGGMGK
jgi:hypothetical protein